MSGGRKSIVWMVQDTKRMVNSRLESVFDTSGAEEFGTRREIFPESIKPWSAGNVSAVEALAEYDADRDYLLLIGSPMLIGMAFAAAADKASGDDYSHMRTLMWDKRKREYVEIIIAIDQLFADDPEV